MGANAQGAPAYDVKWQATDDLSGVKHVTVYVAENGGDFKIWQRQVAPDTTEATFTGVAGSTYQFLAVATDNAGNTEAASVANAVLPDDGSRQAVLDALGVNTTVTQTPQTPLAVVNRTYPANALFQQSTQLLPGFVATATPSDLQSVVAPFTLRGFADGFAGSTADIGALAMVEMPDHTILASAGTLRNEVYRFSKDGGHSTTPLFTLNAPILNMAVDSVGQLWVMTGDELLQVDASSGAIMREIAGPNRRAADAYPGYTAGNRGNLRELRQRHRSIRSHPERYNQGLDPLQQRSRRRPGLRPGWAPVGREVVRAEYRFCCARRHHRHRQLSDVGPHLGPRRAGIYPQWRDRQHHLRRSGHTARRADVCFEQHCSTSGHNQCANARTEYRRCVDGRTAIQAHPASGRRRHARREHRRHQRWPHSGRGNVAHRRDRTAQGAECKSHQRAGRRLAADAGWA